MLPRPPRPPLATMTRARRRSARSASSSPVVGVADDGAGAAPAATSVVAARAVLVLAAAVLAAARPPARLVLEVEQRGQAAVDLEDDVAAVAAVAAGRAAARDCTSRAGSSCSRRRRRRRSTSIWTSSTNFMTRPRIVASRGARGRARSTPARAAAAAVRDDAHLAAVLAHALVLRRCRRSARTACSRGPCRRSCRDGCGCRPGAPGCCRRCAVWPPKILTPRRWPLAVAPVAACCPVPFCVPSFYAPDLRSTRTVVDRLAMAVTAPVVLAALLLEDEDLLARGPARRSAAYGDAVDQRSADADGALGGGQQHLGELDRGTDVAVEALDAHDVAGVTRYCFPPVRMMA